MDKKTALLVVAKDLFVEARKSVSTLSKLSELSKPPKPSREPEKYQEVLDSFADQFIAFHKRLESGLGS